jgi:diguanylate cyclase (GGDEF)-like protein
MQKSKPISQSEQVFAQLGRDLSSTANAFTAAEVILNAANILIGWDACYLILYDPQKGGKPRPLLTIDTANNTYLVQSDVAPDKPSANMLKAIHEDGFLSLYEETFDLPANMAFGDTTHRTLSQLFVPVRTEVRTIGVLSIQSYHIHAYDSASLETLKTLANHCAGAMERIWAQEEAAHLAERLKALYQATHAINSSLDMEQVCDAIHRAVEHVMPCDDFVIDGYNPENNMILPIYAIEHPRRRVITEAYMADHGLAGWVVHKRESVLLNSTAELDASGIQFEKFGNMEEEDHTQSIVAVPMLLHGRIAGMISAQSHRADAYTRDDQYLLELLAAHAAIAIENSRLFAAVETLANTDALTGAWTRRKFYELAEREFSRAKRYNLPLSVIMIDVDEFKQFNDRFGHKAGDLVLNLVAAQCKDSLRGVDIFGRLGGEEFAAVLPNTNLEGAALVAKRLNRLVRQTDLKEAENFVEMITGKHVDQEMLRVTVSVGVAALSEDCPNMDMILDRADHAMYAGKYGGRDQINIWKDGEVG